MRHGRRMPGYSMVFWAVFIALVLLPMLALAIEVGRYSYARGELAKAADAAALAAAIEIDRSVFRDTGQVMLTSATWAQAQAFATANAHYLSGRGVQVVVTRIEVERQDGTVRVVLSASIDRLFPSVVQGITVSEEALARVRAETWDR